jgi:hypothetical protein
MLHVVDFIFVDLIFTGAAQRLSEAGVHAIG